ncbi:helix-turn-helix transcriptional regulator [Streptomyces sp. NBC_01716]|uniref:helix-turn-helix transcriptional regulator n=1 Tax=Streptomyces sp. NBC_01716 TaxID=2975917 RepID=UPI002E31150D|nr:helix-turn-helix domain-containing protein [Streptomyces sp. NBC_01716]
MSLTDEFVAAGLFGGGGDAPTPELATVYSYALSVGGLVPGTEASVADRTGLTTQAVLTAIHHLRRLHLLRERPGQEPPVLVPVDPDAASSSLILPIDEEVHRRQATISRLRQQLNSFHSLYARTRPPRPLSDDPPPLVELNDTVELAGQVYDAAHHCTGTYVSFVPNSCLSDLSASPEQDAGWEAEGSVPAVAGIEGMLARGVRVRVLLQHAARSDIRARKVFGRLLASGAEIRTTDQLPRQLMIFDTDIAFTLHDESRQRDTAAPAGVMIRSTSAVRLLLDMVDSTWTCAHPYATATDAEGHRLVEDSLHRTIVRLLSEGLTDDAVARRLGVSVRTCRRYIAAVLRNLDAVSRFQAGVRVGAGSSSPPPYTPPAS